MASDLRLSGIIDESIVDGPGIRYVIVMKQTSFWAALLACVFPYIPFDLVKIVLVSLLSLKLRPILKTA